jgi:hypothetical protein
MSLYTEDGRPVAGGPAQPTYVLNRDQTVSIDITQPLSVNGISSDAAGRLLVANPYMIFDSTSNYGLSPLLWQSLTSGAGNAIAHDATGRHCTMTLGGANAGYTVSQTYEYIRYQPWRSQEIVMTGCFDGPVAGVTKRIGLFDAKNGLFFQLDGDGTLSVVRRTSCTGSTIDHKYPQSSWNTATLSQLDPTKSWVMAIRFLYLGVAIVQWGFYLDGEVQVVHQEKLANTLPGSYMQTATLPLRYEQSSAAAIASTMKRICSAVNSSGGYSSLPGYRFAAIRDTPVAVATELGLVAIRPALVFGTNNIVNRMHFDLAGIDVMALSNPVRWRLLYYPPGTADPTTGGSWVQGTDSGIESKIGMTSLSLVGAYTLAAGFVPASGGASGRASASEQIDARYPLTLDAAGGNSPLTSNTGATPACFVLAALQNSGNATCAGIIEWTESR